MDFRGHFHGWQTFGKELKSREAARQRRRLDLEDGEGVLAEELLPECSENHHGIRVESEW